MAPPRQRCVLFVPPGADPAAAPPVFALRLVERSVLAFLRAGVQDFLVVGESGATARTAALLREGRCHAARVRAVREGASLAAALSGEDAFYVARADYLYDRRLVERFVAETQRAPAPVVAVDFRVDALASQDGAPRVAGWRVGGDAPGESLRLAGSGLMAPEGVLTGLARVTPAFARLLDDAPPDARSLEDALTRLAQREPVATWAVGELWQSLRADPTGTQPAPYADLGVARRKVLGGAVGIADGLIARYLNRPISRRITERMLSRDVKPWQMSLASFFAVLGAGLSFAVGHAATGGLIAQFASVLDGVDGEIARIRYQDSAFGGVYDALLDRVGDAALLGGMTLYAWLMGAGHSAVALGFAAVAGSSLSMLVKEKYGTQFQRPYYPDRDGRFNWLLLGRDGRLFLTLVAGLTGYVEVLLGYLAVGTHVHAGFRIYRIRSERAV